MSDESLTRQIEAILFASPDPLSVEKIMDFLPDCEDDGLIRTALHDLQALYADRGFNLTQHGGEWMFRTHPDMAAILAPLRHEKRPLSRAAMETLAVIAYHQPLTRAEIESIRGVSSGKGTLDILVEAGWVKPGRRRETPGRPLTWVTTAQFLHSFSLETIRDLPGLQELQDAGLLDHAPNAGLSFGVGSTGELFDGEEEGITQEDDDLIRGEEAS